MNGEPLQTDLSMNFEISLYYDLFVPENLTRPAPLLIAVHGYGAHKRYMMREARTVAPDNFVIASIQAPHQHFSKLAEGYRVGFGWLTDFRSEESIRLHHDFVLRVIDKLAADGLADASRVFLYGFSQACSLNFRFALAYPDTLHGIIGVAGGIPGDLDTNPHHQPSAAKALYLYGDDDEFYTLEKFRHNEARLRTYFPNLHAKQFAAKHTITDEMRDEIRLFLK